MSSEGNAAAASSSSDAAAASSETHANHLVEAEPAAAAAASPSDQPLTIMIRNPTDVAGTPAYEVSVSPSSTVLQIKEQLSASYRDNPPIAAQRLIYAGKLLQNSSTVSSIITKPDTSATHTFHLVVSSQSQRRRLSSASRSTPASNPSPIPFSRRSMLGSNSAASSSLPNASGASNSDGNSNTNNNVTPDQNNVINNNSTEAGATSTDRTQLPPLQNPYAAYQAAQTLPYSMNLPHANPYGNLYANAQHFPYYSPNAYYQQYPQYMNFPMPAVPSATPNQLGASSSTASSSTSGAHTQTPTSSDSYNAHMQTLERLLVESTQAELQAMAAESAAQTYLQTRNFTAATQLRSYATQLHAYAAQLHAQTYAHARAHPSPPTQNSDLNTAEMERLIAEAVNAGTGLPAGLNQQQGQPTGVDNSENNVRGTGQQQHEHDALAAAQAAAAAVGQHQQQILQMLQQNFPPPPAPVQLQPQAQPQANQQQPQAQAHPQQQQAQRQPWEGQNRPNLNRDDGRPQLPRGVNIRFARFPVDANGQLGEPRQFVFRFQLNWILMIKLAFFVYILSQDVSPQRMYLHIALAVMYYMWQIGYLRFMRRLVETALPNPRALIDRLFPAVQRPQRDGENGENNGAEEHVVDRGGQRFGRVAVAFSFVYSFIYGFICSLLPAWNPEPHARIDDLMPQQPGGQADAEQQPRDAQDRDNVNHEHAE